MYEREREGGEGGHCLWVREREVLGEEGGRRSAVINLNVVELTPVTGEREGGGGGSCTRILLSLQQEIKG